MPNTLRRQTRTSMGRGQSAAESGSQTPPSDGPPPFNGAAASRLRKKCGGRGPPPLAALSSFNGAAAKRPRKDRRNRPPVRFQGPSAHSGLGSPPCSVHPASPPPTAPPPLLASRERPAPGAPCRARSRAHTTNDGSLPPVGRAAPIVSMRPGPVPYDGPVSTTSMRSSP